MAGLSIALLLAAAQTAPQEASPPPEPAARLPRRVISARTRQDGWRLEAITEVDRVGGHPVIYSTFCEIKRSGLALTTWLDGGLAVQFADTDIEPDLDLQSRQIRRIAIDETVWEYREVEGEWSDRQFVNVAYPPPPPPCRYCLSARSFTRVMRRHAGDPWLPPDLLNNALLRGRMLRIGFRQEDDEHRLVGPMLWAEVPLAGLDRAIAWCRETLASPAARRIHGELEEE